MKSRRLTIPWGQGCSLVKGGFQSLAPAAVRWKTLSSAREATKTH